MSSNDDEQDSHENAGRFVPQTFVALLVERFDKESVTSRVVDDYKTSDLPSDGMTIKVSHSGLTYQDSLVVQGGSGAVRTYPCIPGTDLAGTILQVDEDGSSRGFNVGDRIVATGGELGRSRSGGYSQISRVPAELCWKLPDEMTNIRAVQLGTAAVTAALACLEIERGDLEKDTKPWDEEDGETKSNDTNTKMVGSGLRKRKSKRGSVLVSGASGSIGSFVTLLLVSSGYRVVAVTRHLDKQSRLARFGARRSIILEDFQKECEEDGALGEETYVGAVDILGDGFLNLCLPRLTRGGVCVAVGSLRGATTTLSTIPFIRRGVRLVGVDSRYISSPLRSRVWRKLLRQIPGSIFAEENDSFQTVSLEQIQPLSGRKLSSGAGPVSVVVEI